MIRKTRFRQPAGICAGCRTRFVPVTPSLFLLDEFDEIVDEDVETLLEAPEDALFELVVDVGGEGRLQRRDHLVDPVVGVLGRNVVIVGEDAARYDFACSAQHRLDQHPPDHPAVDEVAQVRPDVDEVARFRSLHLIIPRSLPPNRRLIGRIVRMMGALPMDEFFGQHSGCCSISDQNTRDR